MITIKQGDTHPIGWTVNLDLTGSTVSVKARRDKPEFSTTLSSTVTAVAPGHISHHLDGTLPAGEYQVEIQITLGNGDIVTAPSDSYETLVVLPDLG